MSCAIIQPHTFNILAQIWECHPNFPVVPCSLSLSLSSTTAVYIYIVFYCSRQYLMQRKKNRSERMCWQIYRIDANAVKYFRVDGYVCRMQLLTPHRQLGAHTLVTVLVFQVAKWNVWREVAVVDLWTKCISDTAGSRKCSCSSNFDTVHQHQCQKRDEKK